MSDTEDSRAGSRFGHYHLRRLLGRGGMGDVYEAEDTVKERVVALKLMSAAFSGDPVFRKRMQREARTAGRLQDCLLYTSPSPRDRQKSRMPSSA